MLACFRDMQLAERHRTRTFPFVNGSLPYHLPKTIVIS